MALKGSIGDFGLADILQLIYFYRKTGILALKKRTDLVRLAFREGNITSAESRGRTEEQRTGKALLKDGLVSEKDLESAMREQKQSGAKITDIFFKKGLVGKEDLRKALAAQVTDTVNRLFLWNDGAYEFEAGQVLPDKDLAITLNTQHLLMEGLRVVDEWSGTGGRMTLGSVLERTPDSGEKLTSEEQGILRFIDAENDAGMIVRLSGIDDYEALNILGGLAEKGVIRERVGHVSADAPAMPSAIMPATYTRLLSLAVFAAAFFVSLAAAALNKESPMSLSAFWDAPLCHRLKTVKEIDKLRFLATAYKYEHGSYPSGLDKIGRSKDMWGMPFEYRFESGGLQLRSAGPDGKFGTRDDIY